MGGSDPFEGPISGHSVPVRPLDYGSAGPTRPAPKGLALSWATIQLHIRVRGDDCW